MSDNVPNYWSKDWLKQEYIEHGRTRQEIAESERVSPSTIQRWLDEYDLRKRDAEKKYQNKWWLKEQYVKKGRSTGTLANLADCSKTTILNYLDEFGIETRDKNP